MTAVGFVETQRLLAYGACEPMGVTQPTRNSFSAWYACGGEHTHDRRHVYDIR